MTSTHLHVVDVPVRKDYHYRAFHHRVISFARMMRDAGADVDVQSSLLIDIHPQWTQESFRSHNEVVIRSLTTRISPRDVICVIGGDHQQSIAEAFPENQTVEFAIGYPGTFRPYRVFASYAWMHTVSGRQQHEGVTHGHFYDEVIPHWYDPEQFPLGPGGDYLLYFGRDAADKGLEVVRNVARRMRMPLVKAGGGDVDDAERARLMGGARAVLMPTLYVEPFGNVAVEAQLCGTPAITTDWGGFTETVEPEFRCRTLAEFCTAVDRAASVDRSAVRQRAIDLYSTDVIRPQYERYFSRLEALWGEGWYA